MFINEYPAKIPFDALKYLTGECNYGGRVTDDKDRRLILTILDTYYCDEAFKEGYKYSPSGLFYPPAPSKSMQPYLDYVATLPLITKPEVFGFHENADITKDLNNTNILFNSVLNAASSGGGIASSQEETVKKVCEFILADFPDNFNIEEAEK